MLTVVYIIPELDFEQRMLTAAQRNGGVLFLLFFLPVSATIDSVFPLEKVSRWPSGRAYTAREGDLGTDLHFPSKFKPVS